MALRFKVPLDDGEKILEEVHWYRPENEGEPIIASIMRGAVNAIFLLYGFGYGTPISCCIIAFRKYWRAFLEKFLGVQNVSVVLTDRSLKCLDYSEGDDNWYSYKIENIRDIRFATEKDERRLKGAVILEYITPDGVIKAYDVNGRKLDQKLFDKILAMAESKRDRMQEEYVRAAARAHKKEQAVFADEMQKD